MSYYSAPSTTGNSSQTGNNSEVRYVKCNACFGSGEDRHGYGDCIECHGYGDIEVPLSIPRIT